MKVGGGPLIYFKKKISSEVSVQDGSPKLVSKWIARTAHLEDRPKIAP
jgi:hypothetical protein